DRFVSDGSPSPRAELSRLGDSELSCPTKCVARHALLTGSPSSLSEEQPGRAVLGIAARRLLEVGDGMLRVPEEKVRLTAEEMGMRVGRFSPEELVEELECSGVLLPPERQHRQVEARGVVFGSELERAAVGCLGLLQVA